MYTKEDILDLVCGEGLAYAMIEYINIHRVDDPQLVELIEQFREIHAKIEKHLSGYCREAFE